MEIKERFNEVIKAWLDSFEPSEETISETTLHRFYYSGLCFLDSCERFKFEILPLMLGKSNEEFIAMINCLDIKVEYGGMCHIFLRPK